MTSATIELPKDVYDELLKRAHESGKSPVEWITERINSSNGLSQPRREPTKEEIDEANSRLKACRVDLGYATGIDNESIDRDLAREYADDHEDLY